MDDDEQGRSEWGDVRRRRGGVVLLACARRALLKEFLAAGRFIASLTMPE